MTHGPDHSPLPWRLESRALGAGKALLVLAANGDLIAFASHTGQTLSFLTEEGRHITRTPEQTEGNFDLLVRAVNASKTLVDACVDVASQLRSRSEAMRQEGRVDVAEGIADLAGALEEALGRVVGAAVQDPPALPWLAAQPVAAPSAVIVDVVPLPPESSSGS